MINLRMPRPAGGLAQGSYALQPVRSRVARVAVWCAICAVSVGVGAAAMYGYQRHVQMRRDACVSTPLAADGTQAELERTRLALAQESTARAAVQKTADAATAEASRLNAQLLFLRDQGKKRR
ncbi:hypothetical protein [Paraburkholderia sp. DHOC27]|uniref:hypothetical protein n=1 Tax=Paraburkholderia sp. DHOC27 TaxID=2303330 RepID=UPI000E3B98EE|nr:hypothetical protein [Paraburkholderia sp. DHOC27]RFU45053.1 hypothetical protein D0B32_25270 [Paraburkholderia sp. DHOC27]